MLLRIKTVTEKFNHAERICLHDACELELPVDVAHKCETTHTCEVDGYVDLSAFTISEVLNRLGIQSREVAEIHYKRYTSKRK